MAAVVEGSNSSSQVDNGQSITVTLAVTSAVLVYGVFGGGDSNATIPLARHVSTAKLNGSSMTQRWSADDGNFEAVEGWYFLNPPTNTTVSVVVTYNQNPIHEAGVGLTGFTGASGTFGTAVTSSVNSSAPSITGTSAAGEYAIGGIATDENTSITESGVLLWEKQAVNADSCFGAQGSTGAASVKLLWTCTGANLCAMGFDSIKASGVIPSTGAYAQELVSTDRYQLEDGSGVYLIEPWGTAATVNLPGRWYGDLDGLGRWGFKDRLNG